MNKLTEFKELFDEILKFHPNLSVDTCLEVAQRIYVSNNISNEQRGNKPLENQNILPTSPEMPQKVIKRVTQDQVNLLHKLKYKGSLDLTSKEASIKIQELMGK